MPSIGTITCTFVKGHCPRPKMRIQTWTVPGLDGYGAQALGLGDSDFSVVAILYTNAAGVETWKEALEALQGTTVTITNDLEQSCTNCLITKVSVLKSTPVRAETDITQRGEITIEGVVLP